MTASSLVCLRDDGNGIFSLRLPGDGGGVLSPGLLAELMAAFETVRQAALLKVLVLEGGADAFARGDRGHYNAALALGLYGALVSFPCPVIGALQGAASGAGFLLGAVCDFMLCSETADYRYTDPAAGFFPTAQEDQLLGARFGRVRAADFLYAATGATGKQLAEKHWNCRILPAGEVEAAAQALAANLARKSADSLRLLKQHLARPMLELVNRLQAVQPAADAQPERAQLAAPGKHIRLETHQDTVLVVQIRSTRKRGTGTKYDTQALAADLAAVFGQLTERSPYRAVVLASQYPGFLPESGETPAPDAMSALQRALLQAPLPVVAVVNGGAGGGAWLAAQFCDSAVYAAEGNYAASGLAHSPALAGIAARMFAYRLGSEAARTILLGGAPCSGAGLRQSVGPIPVVPQAQALTEALRLAGAWAGWPLAALLAWKRGSTRAIEADLDGLAPSATSATSATSDAEPSGPESQTQTQMQVPTPVPLASTVVSATAHPGAILEVRMHDRESSNMFSEKFIEGLNEVFAHVAAVPDYKVVILTGYDTYFATGGTREALVAIQQGKLKFTDDQTFQLALACQIPVIAAMQGHAVGAGLSLGLLADFPLLSEESKYLSPYMEYGFTPGVGATLVVPERMGQDLGRETLLTAQEYDGAELKGRGLALAVYPRQQLQAAAWALAHAIASQPRASLVRLKRHLSRDLRDNLGHICERELAMHALTFVGQAATLEQIETRFERNASRPVPAQSTPEPGPVSAAASPAEIVDTIGVLLAQELHLERGDLDDHTQLVDLGLDSITGVTWIRKVNLAYGVALDATIVYSHPTLSRLGRHLRTLLEQPDGSARMPDFAEMEAAKLGRRAPDAGQRAMPGVALAPVAAPLPDGDGPPRCVAAIKELLARELHLEGDELDEHTQFTDLGLDSITGVTWIRKVNERYGLALDATIVYSYPTLSKLGRHVHAVSTDRGGADAMPDFAELETRKLGAGRQGMGGAPAPAIALAAIGEPATPALAPPGLADDQPPRELVSWRKREAGAVAAPAPEVPGADGVAAPAPAPGADAAQPIAVIGMAGQFPMAKNIDEFWQNIAAGKHCISEVPAQRWDLDAWFQPGEPVAGKTNSKWLGSLEDYDRFDPLFFNLSPAEAKAMDPQQRLFLQACWHGIEHAGYNPKALAGSACGVFVGGAGNDYGWLSRQVQLSAHGFTGNASSILAARISYFLDLQGPCLAIDTACSSSLVAIAAACDSLASGASALALAGGVYVGAGPAMHIMTAQSGMLSADGRCYSFDHRANGFVPGEAVGVVVLKRLADAERDGDIIHALVRGWGVNQDGRTNGITAPNPESQARLMQGIYRRYGIDPSAIGLVEAHGTGTPLGDPIEVEGLKQSFRAFTEKKNYCALGSVKSNIGHCLTAAGVTGFIKAVLALQHRQLPPTINFEAANPHIRLDDTPFYINDRLRAWTTDGARQAAVSSFGYSGTNAHVVLAEYAAPARSRPSSAPSSAPCSLFLIPLSAMSAGQLRQRARDLLDFLRAQGSQLDLADIAYTLQVGREAMDERLGLLVGSAGELAGKLADYVDGRLDIAGAFQGQIRLNKEGIGLISQDEELKEAIVHHWIAGQKFAKLLKLWTRGLEFDWNRLYAGAPPRRVVLPTYPFANERYWIDAPDAAPAAAHLHPLVHQNTSTLGQQRYTSVFGAPPTQDSLLEMAQAAVRLALPERPGVAIALGEVAWQLPFVSPLEVPVTVGLFARDADRVGFEIASQETLLCQGELVLADAPAAAPGAVHLYEEYWCAAPVPGLGAAPGKLRTAVIFGAADVECAGALEGDTLVTDRGASIDSVIRRTAAEAGTPVAVVCTWARGAKAAGVHALFDLFKAVRECGALVAEVVLVGQYDPAQRDSAWDYAWIGFERSLKLVLPDLKVSLLYTDAMAHTGAQLADARRNGGITWYRGEQRLALALRPAAPAPAFDAPDAPMIKQHGTYLISGGCGALGMRFAVYLARNYQARLVLLGRRPLSATIEEQLDGLRRAGAAEVHYAAVDLGSEEALRTWAHGLAQPFAGVFHAAGVEAPRPFHARSAADIEAVLGPKTTGTLLLDDVLQGHPLDFVCYFSSSAAVLGDFGSCDYAIANRFQMAYAEYRSGQDRFAGKTVVINWPFWRKEAGQEGGMGAGDPAQAAFYLKSSGQEALAADEGIRIWHALLRAGRVQTLVMRGDGARIGKFLERVHAAGAAVPAPAALPVRAHAADALTAALPPMERLRLELRQLVAAMLQVDVARLDDRTNLADYGFDSISLTSFAKVLTGHFSIEVTPALFFECSTVQQLVAYFAGKHPRHFEERYAGEPAAGAAPATGPLVPWAPPGRAAQAAPAPTPASTPPSTPQSTSRPAPHGAEPIAVVGMAGRFPQANDVDQLWQLLAEGRSAIAEVPAARWDWRDYFTSPGHIGNVIGTNKGGFIDGVDEFDPLFFEISPAEAEEMDPAERILLMEAYRAIEDARMSPAALRGRNVGVFVGMEESQYGLVAGMQGVTTAGAAMISSRLSYFLDLHGPAIATNTACSSGLVALHQAVASLRQGECEAALVAGLALNLAPQAWIKMSEARMISPDGQCHSFANKANGIGLGEAVVVLMLKPLSAAIADKDHVYGCIRASGINFDGKTNGVTAPNGRAQAALIESVYAASGIDMADVSHIVAHGTGTRLGDPVEINALDTAFGKLALQNGAAPGQRPACAVTSCKTNFGHTLAASGLVSLVGLLKGIEHRKIPASLNCDVGNDYINWRDSHFYINTSTVDWHAGDKPRLGAVSAFGRSGTNAHVIVEEYRAPAAPGAPSAGKAAVIVPLSARGAAQLRQKVRDLLDAIRRGQPGEQPELTALAYTLQVGREPMEERVAFVVASVAELARELEGLLAGTAAAASVVEARPVHPAAGQDDAGTDVDAWIGASDLAPLARHWAGGHELDWERLYGPGPERPSRIALPAYPFARERYWCERAAPDAGSAHGRDDSLASIAALIDKVADGSMEQHQASALLKKMAM